MFWDEEKVAFDEAKAKFPEEFGLRAFPGQMFAISEGASYFSGKTLMLYLAVKGKDGKWAAFCKGTVSELLREVVRL